MNTPIQNSSLQPGATYRFIVRSADEAVQTLRERLGENARVLSVRQVRSGGFGGLFGRQKIEVVAQVAVPEPNLAPYPPGAAPAVATVADRESEISEATMAARLSDYTTARIAATALQRDVPTRLPEL